MDSNHESKHPDGRARGGNVPRGTFCPPAGTFGPPLLKRLFARLLAGLALAPWCFGADVPISSLPAISSVQAATIVPVVDVAGTPTTKKATVSQLIDGLPLATSSTVGTMPAADKAKLDAATDANTASAIVRRDASGNFSAATITAASVTGLSSPVNATDAANKGYVDAAAAGLVIKTPVVAATIGSNITLSGGAPTTLDSVTLHVNDRVLVKDQTTGTQNGIYFVQTLGSGANGTWARTTDADTGAKLVTGSYVFVTGGTTNANAAYTMVTTGTITIGTSTITWNLFSQVTQIQASNILGQIVASQVQDGAINTAKFATGITPVEIVSSLPVSANFTGRTVFLTSDGLLYRYAGGAFTALLPAADISGQIIGTQIQDNSISTPKLQANSVNAGKIAAGAVVAGDLAANAVTAGTIAAAAVSTTELAAGAVNASKIASNTITAGQIAANTITAGQIAAGTITADRLNIASLSAITANIGTITSGTLTSSVSITVGSGTGAVSISSSGLSIASGRVSLTGDGTNPYVRATGFGGHASEYVELNGQNGSISPFIAAVQSGSASVIITPTGGMTVGNSKNLTISSGSNIVGPGGLQSNPDSPGNAINFGFRESGSAGSAIGYFGLIVNGRQVVVQMFNP